MPISYLSLTQIAGLRATIIPHLTATAVSSLSAAQVGAINTDGIAIMDATQVGALSATQVRGLTATLEKHHKVRILEEAVADAVKLSHRYITDRQLPDKAIDMIDEAASRIRMEIDSKPEEMDKLERRIIQLKSEQEALKGALGHGRESSPCRYRQVTYVQSSPRPWTTSLAEIAV